MKEREAAIKASTYPSPDLGNTVIFVPTIKLTSPPRLSLLSMATLGDKKAPLIRAASL